MPQPSTAPPWVASQDDALPSNRPFVLKDALRVLREWQAATTRLGIVYTRSRGGLLLTGHGYVRAIDARALSLRLDATRMVVLLKDATFSYGETPFFTQDLQSTFPVTGLAIQLANHDECFLGPELDPEGLHARPLPGGFLGE